MKLNFGVDTPDLTNLMNATIDDQKKVLWLSMLKMQELAKRRAPVNVGILRNSISLFPNIQGALIYQLTDGVDYGIHVEFGTSPHYVPIEPLKEWSRRVLGDENAAYAVRAKIAAEGTDAQPFFRPAEFEVKTVWVPIIWDRVLGRA